MQDSLNLVPDTEFSRQMEDSILTMADFKRLLVEDAARYGTARAGESFFLLPPVAYRDFIRSGHSGGDDPWLTWAWLYNAGARGAELNGFLQHARERG